MLLLSHFDAFIRQDAWYILFVYDTRALRWDGLVMLQLAVEALDALYCYLLV